MRKMLSGLLAAFLIAVAINCVSAQAVTSDLSQVVQVAAGENHMLALLDDGSVWAWGSNEYGQVGDGTNFTRNLPVMVISEDGAIIDGNTIPVASIAAGANHSIAVLNDGRVVAWGSNRYGQLGDGTTGNRNKPAPVKLDASEYFTVVPWGADEEPNISAGFGHTMAISDSGELYGWGYNAFGQLGNGKNGNSIRPSKVVFVEIDDETGKVKLEKNEETNKLEPIFIEGVTCDLVAAGYNHTIIYADGKLYGFGNNTAGQLGLDDSTNRNYPFEITESPAAPDSLRCGNAHSLMLSGDKLYGWGSNLFGQILLESDATQFAVPTEMMSGVERVEGGYNHNVIKKADAVTSMGFNSRGQIGNGLVKLEASSSEALMDDPDAEPPITDITDPAFGTPPEQTPINASLIAAGYYFSVLIDENGELWMWGDNGYGQLGDGTFLRRPSPNRLPTRVFYEVVKPVAGVTLTANSMSIGVGEDFSKLLMATIKPDNALFGTITWTSSNTDIVAIVQEEIDTDAEDYVETIYPQSQVRLIGNKKTGVAVITATAYNGVKATCKVTVKATPNKIVISTKPAKMVAVGNVFHFAAEVSPVIVYDGAVEWSIVSDLDGSDDEYQDTEDFVASIDPATGLLTALETGTTYVQARSVMDYTVLDVVEITCGVFATKTEIYEDENFEGDKVKAITLYTYPGSPPAYLYGKNYSEIASADCVWTAAIPDVVTLVNLDSGGVEITPHKTGTVTLTCRSVDKASHVSVQVTVKPLGTGIIATSDTIKNGDGGTGEMKIFEGESEYIRYKVAPSRALQSVQWSVVDGGEYVAVSETGKLMGLKGSGALDPPAVATVKGVTIDCLDADGNLLPNAVQAEYLLTVTVVRPITKLVITPKKTDMLVGDDLQMEFVTTPFNASLPDLEWSSDNRNAAEVSDTGVVSAIAPGVAHISAITTDGTKKKVTATITVYNRPESIKLNFENKDDEPIKLYKGKTLRLKATVYDTSAPQTVEWVVEPYEGEGGAQAATISEQGILRVTGTGLVQVYAVSAVDPEIRSDPPLIVNCVVPIKTLTIKPTKITLTQGMEGKLIYTAAPLDASDTGIRYSISEFERYGLVLGEDSPAGEIDPTNEDLQYIEAYYDGSFGIAADSGARPGGPYKVHIYGDGKTVELQITIRETPTGVVIDEKTLPKIDEETDQMQIWKGKTYALRAIVESDTMGMADQTVTWFTSNPDVATIDAKGKLKAVGSGVVEVYCSPVGDPSIESEHVELYCQVPVTSIKLSVAKTLDLMADTPAIEVAVEVKPDDAYNYLGWAVTTRVEDSSVVSIDRPSDDADYFTITPAAAGSETITVSLGGKTASIKVQVRDVPTGVTITTLERDTPFLKGRQLTLRAMVEPPTAKQTVIWESSDPGVATINKQGVVTVIGQGEVTFRAYTFDNNDGEVSSDEYKLDTLLPITGVKLTPQSLTLAEGETGSIQAAMKPNEDAYAGASPVWKVKSSSKTIAEAEIDDTGAVTVTANAPGTCTITVTIGGKSGTFTVRVSKTKE
ncbi:hypothetical protein FACS1894217_01450 [Clostridia bacterium]|nr:hypothetical protein FACS1894217_01450 [Clostridia bacterium]